MSLEKEASTRIGNKMADNAPKFEQFNMVSIYAFPCRIVRDVLRVIVQSKQLKGVQIVS